MNDHMGMRHIRGFQRLRFRAPPTGGIIVMICVGVGSWDARPNDPATQRGRRPKAEAARRGGGDGASAANAGSFKVFNSEDMALFHQAETMKIDAITQVCV